MKLRRNIAVGIAALVVIGAVLIFTSGNPARRSAEKTRRELRQQGFKTDLSDFNFSTSPELLQREQAITNATFGWNTWGNDYQRRSFLNQESPDLMNAIASDAALVVWRQARLPGREGQDLWPQFRELFADDKILLDAAYAAAVSGPIRFELSAQHGMNMLLRHLPGIKSLAQTLGQRATVELHDGDAHAALTDLIASTRLVTAWEVEPAEISHLVRFGCVETVFNTTWQMLQTNRWTDEQLARLQHEWESVTFFNGLPETAAFNRAGSVAACGQYLKERDDGVPFMELVRSPRNAWSNLKYRWQQNRYRSSGVYEDEKALLLHFRDREMEIREAIKQTSWKEMRSLPGVTNFIPFTSKHPSPVQARLNTKQLTMGFLNEGYSFLGRAAEAETRRRLLIMAIALERFHAWHGSYPQTLSELTPELLTQPPVDFMDNKPLRYRLAANGHFVLWSVGLDCLDNGGRLPTRPRRSPYESYPGWSRVRQDTDIVWPRPASDAEFHAFHMEEVKAAAVELDRTEDMLATNWWNHTVRQQLRFQRSSVAQSAGKSVEPKVHGRRLSDMLRNEIVSGTNQLSLDEMLTLKQIVTGAEPEVVTFELPISYNALTNLEATVELYVDPVADNDSDEGCQAGMIECKPAANGNSLLSWYTIFEAPGTHTLQAGLDLTEPLAPPGEIIGPFHEFTVSNLCQFSIESARFNPEIGATARGKLPELEGNYSFEIIGPAGNLLSTITGNTTNGSIKVFWDLKDEQGVRCTNNFYNTVLHVTLPASGRSQTLKGP
ncbi:MAG: hypothetical protein HOP33_15315 [Verrucomicrobia bacterium]|nr:hypothetical protein [Verrucomicrobiota bacterium]